MKVIYSNIIHMSYEIIPYPLPLHRSSFKSDALWFFTHGWPGLALPGQPFDRRATSPCGGGILWLRRIWTSLHQSLSRQRWSRNGQLKKSRNLFWSSGKNDETRTRFKTGNWWDVVLGLVLLNLGHEVQRIKWHTKLMVNVCNCKLASFWHILTR